VEFCEIANLLMTVGLESSFSCLCAEGAFLDLRYGTLIAVDADQVTDSLVGLEELHPVGGEPVKAGALLIGNEVLLQEEAEILLHLSIGQIGAIHDPGLGGSASGDPKNHRDDVGPAPVFHRSNGGYLRNI
jgi:hypothetical protein